jgi:hypothetical protein
MSYQPKQITKILAATVMGVATICSLPPQAEAQIFGGRVRNWIRGGAPRVERIPPDNGPVVIERRYVEPRIVLPRDGGPEYDLPPTYSERPLRQGDDYGPGVSDRVRSERRFSLRRRPAEADYEIRRSPSRTDDIERRSVLRAPEDRFDRDYALDRRDRDVDLEVDRDRSARAGRDEIREEYAEEIDAAEPRTQRRGERTVRVDRFENPSRVDPAADRYEPEDRDRRDSLRDDYARDEYAREEIARDDDVRRRATDRREDASLRTRDLVDRERNPASARDRLADEDLLDEPPTVDRGASRADDRVRPAAAEEEADRLDREPGERSSDRPRSTAADSSTAEDDFDKPRAERAADDKEEDEAELIPAPPQ